MEKVYCSDLRTSFSDAMGLEFNHDAQSWLVNWLLSKHNITQAECVCRATWLFAVAAWLFLGDNKAVCTHVCVMLMPATNNKWSGNRSIEKCVCVHVSAPVSHPPGTSIHLQCTQNALIFCWPFFIRICFVLCTQPFPLLFFIVLMSLLLLFIVDIVST